MSYQKQHDEKANMEEDAPRDSFDPEKHIQAFVEIIKDYDFGKSDEKVAISDDSSLCRFEDEGSIIFAIDDENQTHSPQNKLNKKSSELIGDFEKETNKRLHAIHEKLKLGKMKMFKQEIKSQIMRLTQKVDELEIIHMKKNAQILECDSYLFSSMIIETLSIFVFIFLFMNLILLILFSTFIFSIIFFPVLISITSFSKMTNFVKKCFCRLFWTLKEIICDFLIIILFSMFLLPCILVITTQMICFEVVLNEIGNQNGDLDLSNMAPIKIIMIILFFFMSMKEVSSAWDVIGYFLMVCKNDIKAKTNDKRGDQPTETETKENEINDNQINENPQAKSSIIKIII